MTLMSLSIVSSFDKHVGPWRLSKEILGSGTTSTVVLATRAKLPSLRAAVKVISRRGLLIKAEGDPTALHLADSVIHREVLLMKLATHERVVRLYDFYSNGDLVYIVMEHAPHKTLFDLFRAFPSYLPAAFIVHLFSQFMQGLAHVHDLHIVHRDLKLENVFLFGPDVNTLLHEKIVSDFSTLSIKIGDFGLAHVDDPKRLSTVFHGSPHYQAPEIWRRYAHRSLPTDIWSAGVLFYALLCRCLPFKLAELEAIADPSADRTSEMDYSTSTSILALSEAGEIYMRYKVPEFLSPAADTLLARLFAMTPSARPTARDILEDAFFGGSSLSANSRTPSNDSDVVLGTSVSLYDLATLCVPPGRYVPYEAFHGSAFERAMRGRLMSPESRLIEKTWAQKMTTYAADKEAWETAVEEKVLNKSKKERTRSLGRKFKALDVMAQKETNLAVSRPKLSTTLSFRNLRLKTSSKVHEDPPSPSGDPVHTPHPTPSSSAVAWELEGRREALLRRAYELGFGTEDLRAFADEASRIVHVAKEGRGRMGLEEIAREVERRGTYGRPHREQTFGNLMQNTSACASAATLVPENVSCIKDKAKLLDVPVVSVVDMELEEGVRC